jgi:hypothetical protein
MARQSANSPDRRALKVLFGTYWSSNGWRPENQRIISKEDLEYTKTMGIMFDPIVLTHDEIVRQATDAIRRISRQSVADAFVSSLTSRRLDLRSALGSFALLGHFPKHKSTKNTKQCSVCGVYQSIPLQVDLNLLNFERFKWGGVRHDKPEYALFDLQRFESEPKVVITKNEVETFGNLLKAIENCPTTTTSATLQNCLSEVIASNKAERDVVVHILGMCGILATKEHVGYMNQFVHYSDRTLPDRRFVDMLYPACWWQRSDGVNHEALNYWFGHLLTR